jgi:hypothetical protein
MIATLIVVSLLVVSVLVGILLVVFWKRRKTGIKEEPNYQAFFTMGLSFIAMGVALSIVVTPGFLGFFALGVVYLMVGLKNKDKWKKKV